MASCLVADYGSDSSDNANDSDLASNNKVNLNHNTDHSNKDLLGTASSQSPQELSSESDSDESNSDISERNPKNFLPFLPLPKFNDRLPLPELDKQTVKSGPRSNDTSSVFYNPYLAEESKKLSTLEKHVSLTKVSPVDSKREKKRICYKFRKGKCRFGDRCKFSHADGKIGGSEKTMFDTEKHEPSVIDSQVTNSAHVYDVDIDDDGAAAKSTGKRRKPGLSSTLIPPKRTLAAYETQKQTRGLGR